MGGNGKGVGRVVAKAKTKKQIVEFRVEVTSTRTHQGHYSTTRSRQMCTDSGSNIRSPLPNCSPPLVPFHQSWIYVVGKKPSGEADQLTLTSGGSENAWLFSVAVSWGNKINFSLYMRTWLVFAQTVTHIT